MLIRVHRARFLSELQPMQGIVERRSTIPVLSHLLLRAEGQELRIAATDLDVSMTSSVEAAVETEGGLAVQAQKFIEIVRALPSEEIELEIEGETQLAIRGGSSRFKLRGLPASDFPTLPELAEDAGMDIPFALLQRMIGQIFFAVSPDESRFQLNGALLETGEGRLGLVATDGYRLALVENELPGVGAGEGVLIPRKALQELQRLDHEGDVRFRRATHHLGFGLGRRQLSCRILEGTFPDYQRVIATDHPHHAVFERKVLHDAVQRVALMTGDRSSGVKLELSGGRAILSTANPDLGEAVEEVPGEVPEVDLSFGVNPNYLLQFLAAADSGSIRFELKDEASQAVGVPVDGSDSRALCVIMPMRV